MMRDRGDKEIRFERRLAVRMLAIVVAKAEMPEQNARENRGT